jgi:hypothetical protein
VFRYSASSSLLPSIRGLFPNQFSLPYSQPRPADRAYQTTNRKVSRPEYGGGGEPSDPSTCSHFDHPPSRMQALRPKGGAGAAVERAKAFLRIKPGYKPPPMEPEDVEYRERNAAAMRQAQRVDKAFAGAPRRPLPKFTNQRKPGEAGYEQEVQRRQIMERRYYAPRTNPVGGILGRLRRPS